jgi:hypothetical protein
MSITEAMFVIPTEKAFLISWATNNEDQIAIQHAHEVATQYLGTHLRDSLRSFGATVTGSTESGDGEQLF